MMCHKTPSPAPKPASMPLRGPPCKPQAVANIMSAPGATFTTSPPRMKVARCPAGKAAIRSHITLPPSPPRRLRHAVTDGVVGALVGGEDMADQAKSRITVEGTGGDRHALLALGLPEKA